MPDNVQNATDLRLQIAEHQANLMRLGEAWGQHIVDALDEADRQTIAKLQSLLEKLKFERNTAAGMKQLERIRKEIEKIRVKAYAQAEKKLRDEARALAKNESKWARRILFAFAGLSFVKSLMQPKQQEQQKWLEQYAKEHPLPTEDAHGGDEPEKPESATSNIRDRRRKRTRPQAHGHHHHKQLKVKRLAKPTQEQITKAANVKSGYLPVLDDVLASKTGICFDYAALMTGMLRSQGVPCKLVIGYAGTAYHAWISVWSEDTGWVDGAIMFDGRTWHRMDPTFASSAKKSESIMKYIGDGKNYTAKYLY